MKTTSLAALALVLALPASAQDGFRVGIQAGSMKTTGDAAPLGTDINTTTGQHLDQINFDQPTQAPLALDLAIVKGDDEWSLTWFSTKKKTDGMLMDTATGNSVGMGASFLATGPGVAGARELKATLVDLAWKRTLVKSDRGAFAFSAGLRYSKQSDERGFIALDAAGNPGTNAAHVKGEGTGFGLTAGLHGRMDFTQRVWLSTGFTAALLNNTAKSDDNTIYTSGTPAIQATVGDTHKSLLQTDAYLRFNVNFVKSFNGYLGYEVRDFNRDAARASGQNFISAIAGVGDTSGFGLAGFTLGLSYTF